MNEPTLNNNITPHNPLEGQRPQFNINLHDGTDEQVTIVIVHKDRPEYLNLCLQSIAVTSFNYNIEIIVVDNGSGEESLSFLSDIEETGDDIKVIRNKTNEYWAAAANKGAEAADKNSKYIIFMHCDVVVTNAAWIDFLINVSESEESGFVGVDYGAYSMGKQKIEFLEDYCCLFSKECWNDIGPWETKLPQVGTSFVMTMKAQNAGYKPQLMKNPICHHYRIFSLGINEWERFTEDAMVTIPKLITDIRTRAI